MKKLLHMLSVGVLLVVPHIFASDAIRWKDWMMLRDSVFAKMGHAFEETFRDRYSGPSVDGIRALADAFDKTDAYGNINPYSWTYERHDDWTPANPVSLRVWIAGQSHTIPEGKAADIIVAHINNKTN